MLEDGVPIERYVTSLLTFAEIFSVAFTCDSDVLFSLLKGASVDAYLCTLTKHLLDQIAELKKFEEVIVAFLPDFSHFVRQNPL